MNEVSGSSKKRINSGFAVGLIATILMITVHLVLLLIFQGSTRGDWIAHIIQLLVYFVASQSAAQQQYNAQERSIEALRGVRGAGMGAAITVSILMWIFILVRNLILDAIGQLVYFEAISTFCTVVVDVLLAIALGTWGGSIVEKKYKAGDIYDSSNF